eukprot:TRINITY_DN944_c0_g2_i1.p2 TRINITY_DN944_c0_g2~~TRINITY_DN944_c0_g2_i1.p2  ORF type:complete len:319 (-),score=77.03 TRINITY_DN944_c0_g2_i1:1211-2167(-)
MGCTACGKDNSNGAIKPLQLIIPPFISSKLYLVSENSLDFFSFCLDTRTMKSKQLSGSKYFLDKYKTFPEFFRVVSMRYSLHVCGGKTVEDFCATNFQLITLGDSFTVTERARMSQAKCSMGVSCVEDDSFVLVGGHNQEVLASVEIYQIENNTWIGLPPLNVPRFNCSACLLDKQFLYAIGGLTVNEESVILIERFNMMKENAEWTVVALYTSEFAGSIEAGAFQKSPTEIVICGGYEGKSYTSETYEFNVARGTIVKGKPMKGKDVFTTAFGYRSKEEIYGFGISGRVHMYSPSENAWEIFSAQDNTDLSKARVNN